MTDAATLHSTASSQHRFHFLDALRGVAAILVVFLHAPGYIVFRPVQNAQLAVDFFFCLSGFVIAFSYEKRLQTTMSLRRFVTARVIRLYPIYLLGIVLGIVPFLAFDLPEHMTHFTYARLAALVLLQGVMLPPLRLWHNYSLFPLDFPAWSMFFEMLANVAYAWMVRRRLAGGWPVGAVLVGSFAVLSWWLARGGRIDVGQLSSWTTSLAVFRVAFSIFAGVVVLRLFRRQGTPHWGPAVSGVVALGAALTIVVVLVGPIAFMRERFFTLFAATVLFPVLVYLGARCRLSATWHGVCTFLGTLSYPLYLLHVPFMRVLSVGRVMRAAQSHLGMQPVLIVGVLGVATVASMIASRFYDVPVRGWLTRRYNAAQAPRQGVATQV